LFMLHLQGLELLGNSGNEEISSGSRWEYGEQVSVVVC
jgi:hypothetical protein